MKMSAKKAVLLVLASLLAVSGSTVFAGFEEGMNYFKSGKYVEAAAEFQAIVEASPEYDYGYYILGASFVKMKKYNDAVTNFKKAIELNPDKFEYYYGLAGAYLGSQNYRKVVEALDDGQKVLPDQYKPAFHSMRGQAKYALKNYSQAIEDLEIAVKAKPSAQTWNQIGKCYYELRHYPDAANAYRQSAKLDADNADTQMYLAMALSNAAGAESDKAKKDRYYTEALGAARKYATAEPNDFNAQNLVGRSALGAKKYDDAIAAFNKVLQIKPDYCPAMINKAKSYVALENWKAAEPTLEGAVKCDPSSAVPLELLGFVLRKEQRLEDSLVAYKKANGIAPSAGIQKAIEEVEHNIETRDHNQAAEDAEEKARQDALEAEQKYQEELKKQEEWKRTQEDN